jgi:exodeoxyribonuclease V alpha subunit
MDAVLAEGCLEELAQDEGVVMEYLPGPEGVVTAVYLVPFHRAEVSLANGLLRLQQAPVERLSAFQHVNWEAALGWLRQAHGLLLGGGQEEAMRLALTQKVSVLTGGPGLGRASVCAPSWRWHGPRKPRSSWPHPRAGRPRPLRVGRH